MTLAAHTLCHRDHAALDGHTESAMDYGHAALDKAESQSPEDRNQQDKLHRGEDEEKSQWRPPAFPGLPALTVHASPCSATIGSADGTCRHGIETVVVAALIFAEAVTAEQQTFIGVTNPLRPLRDRSRLIVYTLLHALS